MNYIIIGLIIMIGLIIYASTVVDNNLDLDCCEEPEQDVEVHDKVMVTDVVKEQPAPSKSFGNPPKLTKHIDTVVNKKIINPELKKKTRAPKNK